MIRRSFAKPALIIFLLLLVVVLVGVNEAIKLSQFNNYLRLSKDLKASEKHTEALEALQKAKNSINTTLIAKTLKKEEIRKEIDDNSQQTIPLGKNAEPQYIVTINSAPTLTKPDLAYYFTYKATIKNISVKPYITNFSLFRCSLNDGKNKFSASLMNNEVIFDKAILPGEAQDFIANDVGIDIASEKCFYDDEGNKKCPTTPIYGSAITELDCTGYITTDRSQASNEWGHAPIKVKFP